MFLRSMLAAAFLVWTSLAYAGEDADKAPPFDADAELLHDAGLGAGDLLALLEKWSAADDALLAADRWTRELDSESFAERAAASKALVRLGAPAVPAMLKVLPHTSLEAGRRIDDCLKEINKTWKPELGLAAVRRLVRLHPNGTIAALLRFLPSAADEELVEEITFGLYDLTKADPASRPLVARALTDRLAARRAAAACIVGRLGTVAEQPDVRKLLNDVVPMVRLRAAQGLLAGKDASGISALIALLNEPEVELSWQAEELLHWSAGADAPKETIGAASANERHHCRLAWQEWWRKHDARLDWARIEKDPRRPGLVLVGGDDQQPRFGSPKPQSFNMNGHVWLSGCDGSPRWRVKSLAVDSIQLVAGNRILMAQEYPVRRQTPDGARNLPPILESRVGEFDLAGKPTWAPSGVEQLGRNVKRLPNGNTFVTRQYESAEYGPLGITTVPFNYSEIDGNL